MNSRPQRRIATRLADPDVKSFRQALTVLRDCAARVSHLDRTEMVAGLAAFNHGEEQALERILRMMDDIQRRFLRIRRVLNRER